MDLYCKNIITNDVAILSGCDRRPRRLLGSEHDDEWTALMEQREASIKSGMVARGNNEADLEVGWKTKEQTMVLRNEVEGEKFAVDVPTAKAIRRKESKLETRRLLAEYFDPHVSRNQDDGTLVPDDARAYKTAMLEAHKDNKTKINTLGTKQEIREMQILWPTPPDNL